MKRFLLRTGVFVLVVAAVGVGTAPASTPRAKANAVREAQRLIAAYVPPQGAVRLHRLPAGDRLQLRTPGRIFGKRVDRHRFWLVHSSVATIEAMLQDRRLKGWDSPAIASTGARHGLSRTEATYTVLGFGGRSTGRLLNLTAVKAHGGGSLLRVDVIVVWQLSAADREDLPAGVREIDIHGPRADQQVTDATQVRTIVRWFDRLELYEPQFVALGCPPTDLPGFTFAFHGRHGTTVASASVPELSGICSAASYTVRGHAVTPLIAGDFVYRVQELLGANWIGPPDVLALADHRKAEAAHKAAVLLHGFTPPPGARRTSAPTGYGGVLRSIPAPFGEFVHDTRFWRVPESYSRVMSFVRAHDVPARFKSGGAGSNPRFGSAQLEAHALPVGTRYLEVSAQRARSRTTILRVDAQVVWVYPRSSQETIPAARVREIDFATPKVSKHVTDPGAIARIVRWFDGLAIVPPGVGTPLCALLQTVPVALDFRGAGGKLLAHVSVEATEPQGESGICNPVNVTVGGQPMASLIGKNFIGRVQREIGVTVKAPGP